MPVFSGSTLIPGFAAAMAFLFLGIFFPFYDLIKARKHAFRNGLPLPGRSDLAQGSRRPF